LTDAYARTDVADGKDNPNNINDPENAIPNDVEALFSPTKETEHQRY